MTVQAWFTLALIVIFVITAGIDAAIILRRGRPKIVLLSTALALGGFVLGVLAPVYNERFWLYFVAGAVMILLSAGVRQWPRKETVR